ncbi:MAG: hypothetical protein AAFX93_20075 [Verrucomicrobiota bacterium]
MSEDTVSANHPLLYSADLGYTGQGNEKRHKVAIEKITPPGVISRENGQKTEGPVVHFAGKEKALELCKANQVFMRLACGLNVNAKLEQCIGKEVELQVRFIVGIGNQEGPAIRVIVKNAGLIPFKYQNAKCIGRDKPKNS